MPINRLYTLSMKAEIWSTTFHSSENARANSKKSSPIAGAALHKEK